MAVVHATEATSKARCDVAWMFGDWGCLQEFPVECCHPDVRVTTIYFGTRDIPRLSIARELLQ
jgi:alkylation response protein AidB-like acyl-CoA dehydrogenase